jgi:hypothetical protein
LSLILDLPSETDTEAEIVNFSFPSPEKAPQNRFMQISRLFLCIKIQRTEEERGSQAT